jgi:hypothetical protein
MTMQTLVRLMSLVTPLLSCAILYADGGAVRLVERQGPWQVSVFTSPTPLRAGSIDVSVLVQDAESSQPITDVTIAVRLTPRDRGGSAIDALASSAAATNKLMQAALVDLPHSGRWTVQVTCTAGDDRAELHFDMEAGEPLPAWLGVWPWFSWPFGVVLLFGMHRWLVRRKQRDPMAS